MKELINFHWQVVCRMYEQGYPQYEIAKVLDLTEGRVSQILKQYKELGQVPVYTGGNRGYTPRLSQEDKTRLASLLSQGATAFGYDSDLWTLERVQQLIKREFNVDYCTSHMSNILRQIKWTYQKIKKRLPPTPRRGAGLA